jgi:hypothetical protein
VDFVQSDRLRRKVVNEMARVFSQVDLLLVPSLRAEMLTITNFTGHPSITLRAGFVQVSEARSDWAPGPNNPLPKFSPPRRVPHGVTLIGRLAWLWNAASAWPASSHQGFKSQGMTPQKIGGADARKYPELVKRRGGKPPKCQVVR